MLSAACEPIIRTIQSLAQQLQEIDALIDALGAEALDLHPLQYLISQRKVDRCIRVKQALQDKWHTAMNELAICRSASAAHDHIDQEHVLLGR